MISNSNECSNCVSPISSSSSLSFVSQPLLARIDRSMCRWMEIDQRVRDRYPSNHERLPTIFLRWSLYPSRLATTLNTHTHTHTHSRATFQILQPCNRVRYKRPPLEDCHCYTASYWIDSLRVIYRLRSFMHRGLNREFSLETVLLSFLPFDRFFRPAFLHFTYRFYTRWYRK